MDNLTELGYFSTRQQVEEIVTKYNENIVNFGISTFPKIKQDLLNELIELHSTLKSQEEHFFSKIGIGSVEGLTRIKARQDKWDDAGVNWLLNQEIAEQVLDSLIEDIDTEKLIQGLNKEVKEEFPSLDGSMKDRIIEIINQTLDTSFNSSKKSSLLHLEIKEGKLNITEGSYLAKSMKLKLAKAINDKSPNSIPIPKAAKENAINTFRMLIKQLGIPQDIYDAINYQIVYKGDKFAIAPILAGVKGWIGEIYWNAKWNYIIGKNGSTLATGKMPAYDNRQSPIDMIMYDTGFQIKNWSIMKDDGYKDYTVNGDMLLGNFMATRAEILKHELGQTIARLFGAAAFNKPSKLKKYKETESYGSYKSFYETELYPLTKRLDPLTEVFRTRINKIIEIDSARNKFRDELKNEQYYNTFWLIGDNFIASSAIIASMIKKFSESYDSAGLVDFKVTALEEKSSQSVWPSKVEVTDQYMANKWKIYYSSIFNISGLIEETLKTIKQKKAT